MQFRPVRHAGYVSGAAGSNECPAGSVRIEAEDACSIAAAAAGKTFIRVATDPYAPRGCNYYTGTDDAYLNKDAVGAGNSGSKLLCAALATGVPPHADGTLGGTIGGTLGCPTVLQGHST